MLRRDREEWNALVAALDAQPGGPVHDPESPAWEAKDVYNHFARWIDHSTDNLEAQLAGRPTTILEGSDNEINARWQAQGAGLRFTQARKHAHAAFERRVAAIKAVPLDRWDNPLIAIAHADGYQHYSAHRRYVEAAAETPT